jgi:hypothetical protein
MRLKIRNWAVSRTPEPILIGHWEKDPKARDTP